MAVLVLGAVYVWPRCADAQPLEDATKAWLAANAARIETLDFGATFDDLRPLEDNLRDVRIVLLGEQCHLDGTTFRAKARLVRFLHEEMGFDVLAFESGLYECDRANALLWEGADIATVMHASIVRPWRVDEVRPLFQYLAGRARTERPLLLAGFDAQGTGTRARWLLEDLLSFIKAATRVDPEDEQALMAARMHMPGPKGELNVEARDAGLEALDHLRAAFDAARGELEARHGVGETELFSHVLDNYRVNLKLCYMLSEKAPDHAEYRTVRDAQMAANLRWLADTYYPDKKIIGWGATFHLMHGLQGISSQGQPMFAGVTQMGELVRQHFGDQVYVVGFTAHHGQYGSPWSDPKPVRQPPEGSIERVLHSYGHPLLFVDLRRGNPFSEPMCCSALGYLPLEARWPTVIDGLFFTDAMAPSTPLAD